MFKSMFASERVHMGMQLHAPRLRFAKVWGLAHRGREFLQNLSETEEGLTGDSKLLQTLERGSDNLQSEWAAAEGDSVKWWKQDGPYISQ